MNTTENKTILEWLETAPDEWREKAIKNLKRNMRDLGAKNLRDALEKAFNWANSNEGARYWRTIHELMQI